MLTPFMPRLHPYHLAPLVPLLVLPCTIGIAWLSFRYIESPFLRLKAVLAPRRRGHSQSQPWRPVPARSLCRLRR
jgi:peptidoglycan/LPS O-acetylase OafA/YrhL